LRRIAHSIPHLSLLGLGILIFGMIHPLLALGYAFLGSISMIYFMRYICTRCAGHGSMGCPSGWGVFSSKMFPRDKETKFRDAFNRNIWSVAIQWFVPLGSGIAFLAIDFDPILLGVILAFSIVGFVWLPIAARRKGCRSCPQQFDCTWKSK